MGTEVLLIKDNRFWFARTEDTGTMITEYGVYGGKVTKATKEFTDNSKLKAFERAYVALKKKATDKVRAGYEVKSVDNPALADHLRTINPTKRVMKPKYVSVTDEKAIAKCLPGILMPKLNGISARWENGKLMSRSNVEFKKLAYLKEIFKRAEAKGINVDGLCFELFNPRMNLEEIVHAVSLDDPGKNSEFLIAAVFDRMMDDSVESRLESCIETVKLIDSRYVAIVSFVTASKVTGINDFTTDGLQNTAFTFPHGSVDGCIDGLILHHLKRDTTYLEGKRPAHYIKIKQDIDMEFEVVDVVCDKNKDGLEMISYICMTADGLRFKVVPSQDHVARATDWKLYCNENSGFNPIGRWITVNFREWTKKGLPRHITSARLRDEQTEGKANEE